MCFKDKGYNVSIPNPFIGKKNQQEGQVMEVNQNTISLLPWYSNGIQQNDIGKQLSQLSSIVNECTDGNLSNEEAEKTALEWTKRKQGTLFLIKTDREQFLGTIALSPDQTTREYARFGYMVDKQSVELGVEIVALEMLLPIAKDQGFTKISGSAVSGDISFISSWEKQGVTVEFDEEGK